ncbi:MAG: hypothetical protein KAJ55_04665 [Anaerolineales bacterium]|nr:hypothetical protein [Anaerolineales bacterium]
MEIYNGVYVVAISLTIIYLSLGSSAARYVVVREEGVDTNIMFWFSRIFVWLFWLPLLILALVIGWIFD